MTIDTYYTEPIVAAGYDNTGMTMDDIPFYVELARGAASRGEDVLELACGTGRVTLPVAQAGARTTGLDNSVAMLDIAERKADAAAVDVTWVQGDMASFQLDQRFGLVIIPCRSFLMLLSTEQQKSCMQRVHEHLSDGGLLALNIFNPSLPYMVERQREGPDHWRLGDDGSLARREYHTAEQMLIETRRECVNGAVEQAALTLRVRWIYRYEMQYLLEASGFAVEALYGWFDGRPFDDASTEMVWVARKA
jgi:2-polyprenyl-3-methyl-5-hydroxy-6-metoxy-1,4-benzoquinol methylase